MPIDSYFSFDIRAEQINQAWYGTLWTYTTGSNLTIQNLAGFPTGNRGIYHSNYTDGSCNTANLALEANINPYTTTTSVPSPYHTTSFLRFTNPGPPVPSIYCNSLAPLTEAFDSQEFHGTCKPVSFGDWQDHGSQNQMMSAPFGFDGYFATAGYDPSTNKVHININQLTEVSVTQMSVSVVTTQSSGLPPAINSSSKIRLFAHPKLVTAPGPPPAMYLILIAWDSSSNIFLENYTWDGTNINAVTSGGLGGTTNDMMYTGQHDIIYLNNGNLLLQTWNPAHTVGTTFEINPVALSVIGSITSDFIAYDPITDVIGTRRNNSFETYVGSIATTAIASISCFGAGNLCYDALWHPDEVRTMYVAEQNGASSMKGYRFQYNAGGGAISVTSRSQNMANSVTFNRIERSSENVLVSFEGPNKSVRPLFRGVCDSGIYRGASTGIDYGDALTPGRYVEDVIQMTHPTSQDYTRVNDTNSDSTIAGNNHLITTDIAVGIGCWGQNYLLKNWNYDPTGSFNQHHNYILYLGYLLDMNGNDSYHYIAVTGLNSTFTPGTVGTAGQLSWVKFRVS